MFRFIVNQAPYSRQAMAAPPAFARMAAAGMGAKARVVEFAHAGYGVQQSSACGEGLVTALIRNPSNTADPDCAAQIPPVGFQ